MGSINKRLGPITSPVIRDGKPISNDPRDYQYRTPRPNPGKGKVPQPVMPGGPEGTPTQPEDPRVSQPVETAPSEAQTLAATVGAQVVPSAVTQETKKGPKRRKPTTGTLGSAGSLL